MRRPFANYHTGIAKIATAMECEFTASGKSDLKTLRGAGPAVALRLGTCRGTDSWDDQPPASCAEPVAKRRQAIAWDASPKKDDSCCKIDVSSPRHSFASRLLDKIPQATCRWRLARQPVGLHRWDRERAQGDLVESGRTMSIFCCNCTPNMPFRKRSNC